MAWYSTNSDLFAFLTYSPSSPSNPRTSITLQFSYRIFRALWACSNISLFLYYYFQCHLWFHLYACASVMEIYLVVWNKHLSSCLCLYFYVVCMYMSFAPFLPLPHIAPVFISSLYCLSICIFNYICNCICTNFWPQVSHPSHFFAFSGQCLSNQNLHLLSILQIYHPLSSCEF